MNTIVRDSRVSLGWVLVASFVGIAATASLMTPTQRADATISELASSDPVGNVLTRRGYRPATTAASLAAATVDAVESPDVVEVPSSVSRRRAQRTPMVLSYGPSDGAVQIMRQGRHR